MKARTPIPNSTQGYSTFFSALRLQKPNPSVSNVQKTKHVKRKNMHTTVSSEKFLGCFC